MQALYALWTAARPARQRDASVQRNRSSVSNAHQADSTTRPAGRPRCCVVRITVTPRTLVTSPKLHNSCRGCQAEPWGSPACL